MTRFRFAMACGLVIFAAGSAMAQPSAAANAAFNSYVNTVEAQLVHQHQSENSFIAAGVGGDRGSRLRAGEFIVEQLTPRTGDEPPGALLHHWCGTAFAPGAHAADFERLMENFSDYPRTFDPQVLQARVLAQEDDHYRVLMRVRQRHVITVVMDATYDIAFGRLDARHGYSTSRSTRIAEIESPGTSGERALSSNEEHGFLWRMNTYWSYEERDGGLYIQVESVSLTRSIPRGLGWAVGPYVESVPRESLEFTLRSVCNALRK